nr:hypothetical protein GCM10020093_094380 [Planobispora longispora]
MREKALEDRVTMHGFLSEEEKVQVLGGAQLHVTASEFEGWGLTVIEAAALGVPTVAYDVAGLRDSVRDGETGWLVREGETLEDVVDRALKLLSDPVRREEIAHECRQWAGRFTWRRTGAAMTELIAGEPAGSPAAAPARWRPEAGERMRRAPGGAAAPGLTSFRERSGVPGRSISSCGAPAPGSR